MRIIGGRSKGQKVFHDRSGDLRPTSAKVREALFNIIQGRIEGSRFMDLFAGTGAVGIEALSRQAAYAAFIEADRERVKRIRKTIERMGMASRTDVFCLDALKYLSGLSSPERFDVIFADPPYGYGKFDELMEILYNRNIVGMDGIVVIEHSAKKRLRDEYRGFALEKEYRYGDTMLSKFGRINE
jgi:16S rRNA (guanine(966)-N(2))-methyltransferase RsmD